MLLLASAIIIGFIAAIIGAWQSESIVTRALLYVTSFGAFIFVLARLLRIV